MVLGCPAEPPQGRPPGILRPPDRDVAGHRRHIADENASSLGMLFLPRGHVTGKLMDGHEGVVSGNRLPSISSVSEYSDRAGLVSFPYPE